MIQPDQSLQRNNIMMLQSCTNEPAEDGKTTSKLYSHNLSHQEAPTLNKHMASLFSHCNATISGYQGPWSLQVSWTMMRRHLEINATINSY